MKVMVVQFSWNRTVLVELRGDDECAEKGENLMSKVKASNSTDQTERCSREFDDCVINQQT